MGNQQQGQKRVRESEEESNSKVKANKVPHANTYGLKNPPVIYEAYSQSGPTLRPVQIDPADLNNYIHTKNPKANVDPKFSRGEDYAYEEDKDASLVKSRAKIWENDPDLMPRYRLKIDDQSGTGDIQKINTFDYEKKLRHCVELPKKAEIDPSEGSNRRPDQVQ